jgi:hypothetical protein
MAGENREAGRETGATDHARLYRSRAVMMRPMENAANGLQ